MDRDYDGKDDAEYILEKILKRVRWTPNVRDDVARCLTHIRQGFSLSRETKQRQKPRRR